MIRPILTTVLLLTATAVAAAQETPPMHAGQSFERTVDQLMAAYDGPETPGGVVAVVRGGTVEFAKGYGMADLEHGIPNAPELRYNVGSVAKQFTAFAIALLAERGELSLDDDIRVYLPEVPGFGDTIRIRHLLHHTSGLREYLNLLLIGGRDLMGGDAIRRDEVLRLVARQPELQSAPGSTFLYNNTGYLLLAEIVERVGGQPFDTWMAENVFRPLGMEETVVVTEIGQLVPRRAGGHTPTKDGGFRRAEDLSGSWGPGGLHTTVGDLAKWLDNFRDPRVGGPGVIEAMTSRGVLTTGDTLDYALGVIVDQQRGLERIRHGGNDLGHAAQVAYYPALDAGVIVLSNLAGGHSSRIADQVAEAFFGEQMGPAPDTRQKAGSPEADTAAEGDVVVPHETLERYAGEYQIPGGPRVGFTLEDGDFHTQIEGQQRYRLRALSDSSFQVLVPGIDARVAFHAAATGPAGSRPSPSRTAARSGCASSVRSERACRTRRSSGPAGSAQASGYAEATRRRECSPMTGSSHSRP